MSRIRFEHTETPRDADARYGETVVSIMRDGVQIARVIVMADAGSEERGKPLARSTTPSGVVTRRVGCKPGHYMPRWRF